MRNWTKSVIATHSTLSFKGKAISRKQHLTFSDKMDARHSSLSFTNAYRYNLIFYSSYRGTLSILS